MLGGARDIIVDHSPHNLGHLLVTNITTMIQEV